MVYTSPHPAAAIADSLATAIKLAAGAVPLLGKVLKLSDAGSHTSSSPNSTARASQQVPAQLVKPLHKLLEKCVCASDNIVQMITTELDDVVPDLLQGSQIMQPRRKQQQQILLSDELPELVMLLLADQAAGLPASSLSKGQPPHTQQQQLVRTSGEQQQQQCQRKHHARLQSSSKAVVNAVGIPSAVSGALNAANFSIRACDNAILLLLRVIQKRSDAVEDASSSNNKSKSSHSGVQQQLRDQSNLLLAEHLILPAVRLMIEFVVLLPAEEVIIRDVALDVVKLLLDHMHKHHAGTQQQQSSSSEAAEATATTIQESDTHPWPEVTAVVAAGLLHPVLQLLSRAVVRCKRATSSLLLQQKQKQQKQPDAADCARDISAEVGSLEDMLSGFGTLLRAVCHSGV